MRVGFNSKVGSNRERGGVLVLALMAVMSVTVLAAGFLQLSTAVTRRQVSSLDGKRAFYLAEAGLAESYAALATGLTGNVGSPAQPAKLGDGVFWVEMTPSAVDASVRIKSTAMVGSGRASVAVVAEPREITIGALGVFSVGQLDVGRGTLIDGWNSMKGPYADQLKPSETDTVEAKTGMLAGGGGDPGPAIPDHARRGALIGSNADINIIGGSDWSFLFGRAEHGPSSSYSDDGNAMVTGSVKASAQSVSLPAVQVPAISMLPHLTVSSPTPEVINGVDKGYLGITVAANSELIVRGPANLIVDDITVDPNGKLTLDSSTGPIQLFVKQTMTVASRAVVETPSGDPTGVTVQASAVGGDNVQLSGNSEFHGTIYSPSTGVAMGKDFELFGAVVGGTLTLADGARLHVDKALGKSLGLSALPTCMSWRIVENPTMVATNRSSVNDVLGVDINTLPDPKDSHADVWLEVDYKDAVGAQKTYTGWDSSFNWTDVSQVNDLTSYTDDPGTVGVLVF